MAALDEKQELEMLRLRKQKAQAQSEPAEPSLGEKAGAFGYGAATSALGGLGEMEEAGTRGANWVTEKLGIDKVPGMHDPDPSNTTFARVKNIEELASDLGIKKPREEVSGYRTAGDVVGSFAGALPAALRGGTKALLGLGSKVSEESAKAAEKLGFKLSPAQVRRTGPTGQRGATLNGVENQDLANKLVSRGTGKEAEAVTDKFIGERLKTLGGEFDKLYNGKRFNIDPKTIDALRDIAVAEKGYQGAGAAVDPVLKAAQDIVGTYDAMARKMGKKNMGTFAIDGEALQRLRNALTQKGRSTSAQQAHEIYGLVDQIDASVARNHPDIAKALDELRPKYRNAIILDDLYRSGGIKNGDVSLERLGNILKTEPGATRMPGREVDHLGKLGKDLYLRAQWEPTGAIASEELGTLSNALGTKLGVVPKTLGLQSSTARALQRKYAGGAPANLAERAGATSAAGNITRPLNPTEE